MRKTLAVSALSCTFVLAVALALPAGPLDRTNTQPRTNPTSQSMIRVPGVVGTDLQSAMSSIQQAGKRKHQAFEEEAGRFRRQGGFPGARGRRDCDVRHIRNHIYLQGPEHSG